MVFRPSVYKALAVGVNITRVQDNYGRACGVALYVNLIFGGFGLSIERNPQEPPTGKAT